MAKRKLSRKQAWRVQKVQDERLARIRKKAANAEKQIAHGALGPESTGLVLANFGPNLVVEDADGRKRLCVARANMPPLVCGDRVVWQTTSDHEGVIVALVPRKSVLSRPDFNGRLRPVAANLDEIIAVAAPKPGVDTDVLDRYLVAAETVGITPVILINKIDLLDDEAKQSLEAKLEVYRRIGYTTLYASTKTAHGMDALERQLAGKTSVLVGQSGVGKSSLIKTLLPDIDIRIGALSEATGLGTHTTTAAMLYHLPHSGDLIDSPGVRQFGLWQLSGPELAAGFVDFRPYLGKCKYRNCTHTIEPGCAVVEATEAGQISPVRLQSYRQLLSTLE